MGIPEIHNLFHQRLAAVRRKEMIVELLQGLMFSVFVFVVALLCVLVLEDILHLDVGSRTVAFWLLLSLVAILFFWRIGRPLTKIIGMVPGESDEQTAKKVGDAFTGVRDRLHNALQLIAERETTPASRSLVDESLEDTRRGIEGIDFTSMVNFSGSGRMAKFLAIAGSALLLLFVLFPTSFFGAAYRLLNYSEAFASPAPFHFVVNPGDREVMKGESVVLRVRVEGARLPEIALSLRPDGQSINDGKVLTAEADGTFQYEIAALKSTMRYSVGARGVQSPEFALTVIDRPVVKTLKVGVSPPAYSRLPQRQQEDNVGDVTGLKGTRVSVSAEASKGLRSAAMVFSDGARRAMNVAGRRAAAATVLSKDGSYHIELHDSAGTSSSDPVEYALRILPDAFPAVTILMPGTNLDIVDNMTISMMMKVNDDYGFSRLRLGYRLAQSRYEKPSEEFSYISLPLPPPGSGEAMVPYTWNLEGLHLVPEDVISYHVEVSDNDVVSGPKSARSESYTLRLPSLHEVFADADTRHDTSIEQMKEALKQAEEARKEMTELQQDLKKQHDKADWQEKTKAEELLKKYEAIREKMQEVNTTVQKMTEDLQKNQVLSKETIQKYQELQDVMQQMESPEFADAMKKLQQSMQMLSPEAMKQALQQFSFSEENFRKSIERTLNLLKRIQIEQKVDEAVRRTEEMMKRQEALRQRTDEAPQGGKKEMEALSREQQEMKDRLDALKKAMSELQQKMGEFPGEMPMKEMEQSSKELEQSGLEEQMKEIVGDLQQMNRQQASAGQQKASGMMEKVARGLREMQQSLRRNQQQQIVNEMRRALQDLLELSRREEELKKETQSLEGNSQRFRENAREQMEVMRDLGLVTDRLSALSQKTFSITPEIGKAIGNAIRSMSDAMQSLDQRNRAESSQKQGEAMGALNEAAQQMQAAANAMSQGGGQGMGMSGLMQRLQRMSGQQQGINEGTSGMGGMTPEQAAAMGRLAAEQGVVRKSLEQLTKEAAASSDLSKLLGDLNRVAQEMREVQTDLAGGTVNPETLKKQERILSRLLDAQRSTRERDFEQQRKASAGKTLVRPGPGAIDLSTLEGRNRLRRDLQKALEEGYAKDYEDVIRRYFEALEQYESGTR